VSDYNNITAAVANGMHFWSTHSKFVLAGCSVHSAARRITV